jgi:hypothetical protein
MKNTQTISRAANQSAQLSDQDARLPEHWESRLLAELEITVQGKRKRRARLVPRHDSLYHEGYSGPERRTNRIMHLNECYPNGRLALRGKLSGLTKTLGRDTYRAFLKHEGRNITVLYVNFNLRTCMTCDLFSSDR